MNRKIIIIFLVFFMGCITTEKREIMEVKPFFFGEIKSVINNNFNSKNNPSMVQFRYVQKKNSSGKIIEKIEIYYNDYTYRTVATIDEKDRKKLLEMIKDYKKIEAKALKEKKQVKKEIGKIKTDISWNKIDDNWIESKGSEMKIYIIPVGKIAHNLEIVFTEAITDNDKYNPGSIIVKENRIEDLIILLSDDNFNKEYEKAKASSN